jgi:hypothetical protein
MSPRSEWPMMRGVEGGDLVPAKTLARGEERRQTVSPPEGLTEEGRAAARQAKRVRRLKIHAVAWGVGTIAITGLWVLQQWQSNGAFEHFGSHSGNPGDWNPTLWALAVGIWGLIVGIKALRVHFERPPTEAEIDRELERGQAQMPTRNARAGAEDRRFAWARLERSGRLKFHIAAWALAMIVLTPLWALIEWQDNGGLEHSSGNGQPGDWEPWILYVAGFWALGVAIVALHAYFGPPASDALETQIRRLRSRHES